MEISRLPAGCHIGRANVHDVRPGGLRRPEKLVPEQREGPEPGLVLSKAGRSLCSKVTANEGLVVHEKPTGLTQAAGCR